MAFIEAIGRAFGNGVSSLNPWTVLAGYLVARKNPRSAVFYLWFALSVGGCVVLNILSELVFDTGSSFYEGSRGLTYTAFALLISTVFFLILRKVVRRPTLPRTADRDKAEFCEGGAAAPPYEFSASGNGTQTIAGPAPESLHS